MSAEPKKDVYEWYVSFSDVEAVFQEDVKQTQAKDNSLILVSGCGNSTLCEDISDKGKLSGVPIWHEFVWGFKLNSHWVFSTAGFKNVHGMDYSPSVIKNMQERSKDLKLSHIRYFQVISLKSIRAVCVHLKFSPISPLRCDMQADARYMPDIATGTYDVLFDKGTLDAIASAGASDGATVQVSASVCLRHWFS